MVLWNLLMHKENQTAKNKGLNFIPSDPTISARYAGTCTWKKPGRDLSVRSDQLYLYKMRDKNGKLTLMLEREQIWRIAASLWKQEIYSHPLMNTLNMMKTYST